MDGVNVGVDVRQGVYCGFGINVKYIEICWLDGFFDGFNVDLLDIECCELTRTSPPCGKINRYCVGLTHKIFSLV